ncbi:MAG: SCO6745 family protein [Ilumatobacteraceae bacterium]
MTQLGALETIQTVSPQIGNIGGRFMLHPDTLAIGTEAGYSNGYAWYITGRGGVLGDVDADVVAAVFAFFNPRLVREMWEAGTAVEGARRSGARFAAACAAWGRQRLQGIEGCDRFSELAERVVNSVDVGGLPLFAGWRSEPLPSDAEGRAYHLLHVMREWRGSVHVVAVLGGGLTPLQAILARDNGSAQAKLFGWGDDLSNATHLKDSMVGIELLTDNLMLSAYETALDANERAEFVELVNRFADAVRLVS